MINFKELRNFDLNVLPIFLCVYKHSSILKAANELNTSSPNVTQNLNKMRKFFNDPLFIREGQKITPTAFCSHLYNMILNDFGKLCENIILPTDKKDVVIYSPYGPIKLLIEKFASVLEREGAPKIVHYTAIASPQEIVDLFSFKKADIVISTGHIVSSMIVSEKIYNIHLPLVCRNDHPNLSELCAKDRTAEHLIKQPWVSYNYNYDQFEHIAQSNNLRNVLQDRRVVFKSDSPSLNIQFIERSNAIGFIADMALGSVIEGWNANLSTVPFPETSVGIYINYRRNVKDITTLNVINMFKSFYANSDAESDIDSHQG